MESLLSPGRDVFTLFHAFVELVSGDCLSALSEARMMLRDESWEEL